MADWEALAEGFRYDLWANRRWLECLNRKEAGDPDRRILGHIAAAQQVWVLRLSGESLTYMPTIDPTEEALVTLNSLWLDALKNLREDRVVEYRRTTGEPHTTPISEIATHVINHGTYHRGELRGLCLAREDTDFPETDRVGYFFQRTG